MGRPKKQLNPSDVEWVPLQEGGAQILVPENATNQMDPKVSKDDPNQKQSVFYNPIQQFNRDMSVLAIKAFSEDMVFVRRDAYESSGKRARQAFKYVGRNWKANQRKAENAKRRAEEDSGTTKEPESPTKKLKTNFFETEAGQAATMESGLEGPLQPDSPKPQPHPTREVSSEGLEAPLNVAAPHNNANGAPELHHGMASQDAPQANLALEEEHKEFTPHFTPRFTILDALSATGLRALRYASEIPAATSITAVDLSAQATAQIEANVRHNQLSHKIRAVHANAQAHMYSLCSSPDVKLGQVEAHVPSEGPTIPNKYDVIDLDPYGTAAPFLDAAIQAIADNGMLAVTCTDAGVWASNGYPEKCYALYGGTPFKGLHSHEGGLRLILNAIASSAARYGMSIEPLLSLSIDFYARVFVRVKRSPAELKFLAGRTVTVYNCDSGCGAWAIQPLARHEPHLSKDGTQLSKHSFAQAPVTGPYCQNCGMKTHLGGPMWGGPLHNVGFIRKMLELSAEEGTKEFLGTHDRVKGMLTTALEEVVLLDPELRKSPPPEAEPSTDTPDPTAEEAAKNKRLTKSQQLNIIRPLPPIPAHTLDKAPFYLSPSSLARVLHCQAPSDVLIKGALRHLGYNCARSHTKPGTIKTDAPWGVIWHVMREWVRQRAPLREGVLKPGMAGWGIMHGTAHSPAPATANMGETALDPALAAANGSTEQGAVKDRDELERERIAALPVVFDEKLGRDLEARGVVRYQVNPRANWGPMGRAKGR